ncbi:MAG: hypothetical protein ACLRNQ_05840 [Flavonifractor plautii]
MMVELRPGLEEFPAKKNEVKILFLTFWGVLPWKNRQYALSLSKSTVFASGRKRVLSGGRFSVTIVQITWERKA